MNFAVAIMYKIINKSVHAVKRLSYMATRLKSK